LHRFIRVIEKFPNTQFSCITDNLEIATVMAKAFANANLTIPVFLDLNVGMNRTGIIPGPAAVDIYTFLSNSPGVKAAGLHAYDGHIRDTDITARTKGCHKSFEKVRALKGELEGLHLKVAVIVAGGSPSFPIHAENEDVECSPGTFVYWDKGYVDGCPEQPFMPAAILVSRVVSIQGTNNICIDLGHKSVAAENELGKRVYFLNASTLRAVGQSEEHLVLESREPNSFRLGDVLYGIPFHVCPTVALHEKVYTIENGKITGDWSTTARDKVITI
jgi:D-serine deaminase-like pyridoxal phosphate-dependent protein